MKYRDNKEILESLNKYRVALGMEVCTGAGIGKSALAVLERQTKLLHKDWMKAFQPRGIHAVSIETMYRIDHADAVAFAAFAKARV